MFSLDEINRPIAEYLGGFPSASNEALERCKKRISTQITDELQVNRLCEKQTKMQAHIFMGLKPRPRRGVIRKGQQKSVPALRNALHGKTRDEGKSAINCLENSA
ncbi:hypothetical protein HNY73_013625 [Argiope bruennichi]|uniref:Uncharacterized protein n=1 Tax=Argiope bruennichi TaxID=94029 RepID=A0A8T0F3H7_ARGBR|nr:hypothetical protein HNY73_013625 [Argiope bruennichi]